LDGFQASKPATNRSSGVLVNSLADEQILPPTNFLQVGLLVVGPGLMWLENRTGCDSNNLKLRPRNFIFFFLFFPTMRGYAICCMKLNLNF